jgi:hypothetical protein
MTPQQYIQSANGVFIVERFEDDTVTTFRLADLLRDGIEARKVEFRNGASLLAQAEAYGEPISFDAGALIQVTTLDTVRFHVVNVVPRPGTKAEAEYTRALALIFKPKGLVGLFGI